VSLFRSLFHYLVARNIGASGKLHSLLLHKCTQEPIHHVHEFRIAFQLEGTIALYVLDCFRLDVACHYTRKRFAQLAASSALLVWKCRSKFAITSWLGTKVAGIQIQSSVPTDIGKHHPLSGDRLSLLMLFS